MLLRENFEIKRFPFSPALAVSVSDNFSSPNGDSRWGRDKWLEVTVHVATAKYAHHVDLWDNWNDTLTMYIVYRWNIDTYCIVSFLANDMML